MRIFSIIYLLIAMVFSAGTVIAQVFPATIVVEWIADTDGRFMIVLAVGLLFIMCIVPLVIIFILYNLIMARKQHYSPELLDQTGIVVRRDKTLYGAAFPIDILVNDQRLATVTIGKSRQITLPTGEHILKVKAMGKSSEGITVQLSENKAQIFKVGFRLNGRMQDVYIEEVN